MKEIPQRTCIVCRKKGDKKDFVRIVKVNTGDIVLDKIGKTNGRGAYICNNAECLKKCEKTHALDRAFKMNVPPDVYKKLQMEFYEEN